MTAFRREGRRLLDGVTHGGAPGKESSHTSRAAACVDSRACFL